RDDLTSRSYAIFGFPLALCARRASSIASRLPGTNRLGFQPSLAVSEGDQQKIQSRVTAFVKGATINCRLRLDLNLLWVS
ncbi:MAG: hypothetical protein RPU91_03665, partial [Candidatus Sedimenticola sp. (ex Thyasira tokunagai)]